MADRVKGLHTESQFFERATRRLRPQEPDENGLGGDPAAVDEQVLPADGLGADGIDVGAKELRSLAPELEDGDTAGTLCVREDLDKVGCFRTLLAPCCSLTRVKAGPTICESIEAEVIGRAVSIDPEERQLGGGL